MYLNWHRTVGWIATNAFVVTAVGVPLVHGPQHSHLPGSHDACCRPSCEDVRARPPHPGQHTPCCHHEHVAQTSTDADSDRPQNPEGSEDCPICEQLGQPVIPASLIIFSIETDLAVALSDFSLPGARTVLLLIPPARGPPQTA